ncbi:MAG TPA: response regulator [Roseiflexaceae bacterium]|nr:response regulator [Roseiflexaceae bacterium]
MTHQQELPEAEKNRKTILLVDDEFAILSLLQDTLEDAGYLVLAAADGQQALALVSDQAPNLVLTDIMMPRLDGVELARRLRADPRTRHIPILAMSAAQRPLKSDMFATILAKPFDLDDVIAQIRHCLSTP